MDKSYQKYINEQGLLVLAKTDIKLPYLIGNNFLNVRTNLRTGLLGDNEGISKNDTN